MRTITVTGQRCGMDLVASAAEGLKYPAPHPCTTPCAVDQNEG